MIPFNNIKRPPVEKWEMREIFEAVKTPYKYGAVMKVDGYLTDSPSVFYYDGRWYMYYIKIGSDCAVSGYESHIAVSDDLLHFETVKSIFERDDEGRWDSRQVAAYAALPDIDFGGTNELNDKDGKYYITYLGGGSDGYEPDPLYMGIAEGDSPIGEFVRRPEPILRPDDEDIRVGEERTLYRSYVFEDKDGLTGHRYVTVYNGKNNDDRERIYLAVSNDLIHFERYGDRAIIDDLGDCPTNRISGDAQIVKIGDIYVLFYFRIIDGERGYDTFAASRDLVSWEKWSGEPLIRCEEEWENVHAHKPWIIKVGDVVYHYYCVVNSRGERFIALATSKRLNG